MRSWREGVLLLVLLSSLGLILAAGPIPQDPRLLVYADERAALGVPNFFNVVSNVAFLLVGIAGLFAGLSGRISGAERSWFVLFLGVALVCFGSAYYHWRPSNDTLVWDRLPMTLAFMGMLAAVVSEHLGEPLERWLLAPALVVGIASVLWWDRSGDLRFYIWVQLSPFLALVVVLLSYPSRYSHRAYLWYGLGLYALAKLAEALDPEIYSITARALSGHVLKHLLAAGSVFVIYLMLLRRSALRPRKSGGDPAALDSRVRGNDKIA
jgi:hypothetical protein